LSPGPMPIEWSLAGLQDVIAAAVPNREMLVWKDVRRTYGEVAERSKGLAGFFLRRSIGLEREREGLERWECGQVPVALVMNNRPEYIESMLGCYRARAVPFNVNHQYNPAEVRALLEVVGAGAVVYQRSFGPLVAAAVAGSDVVLVDIDDGSGVDALEGSVELSEAIEEGRGVKLPAPTGHDLYLVCTGGTTGVPKGVLWRQADVFVAAMGGNDETTAESLTASVTGDPQVWFAVPPLMHAASQWTAFAGLHMGATVVMHDDGRHFDAAAILEVAERERVNLMSMVGDAYARPLVEELRRGSYDLGPLRRIGTGGAMTSMENTEALLELLPEVTVVDGYGASETGGMAFGAMSRTFKTSGLVPAGGGLVLSEDRSRLLDPGEDEIGWIARRGRVPLGYLDDRQATESTFPIVDGERFAVPGDRGRLQPDGSIRMLGRDAMVVNTGGEKVFVEEVEQALLRHPEVVDVLVVGRPSSRFGQEVVAIVQLAPGAVVDGEHLREFSVRSVARFKAPRAVVFTDSIGRHPTGKPDYQWARSAAERAVAILGHGG
jgi:acyl-CoA synthetase (AMP-forming)/AMP-acid ligase II